MTKNISGRTICAARGISPSAVDNFIRDYGFETVDRSSALPGRGRHWSYRDLLRLCLALRLHDLGLSSFGTSEVIPSLSDLPEDVAYCVVEVFDASDAGGPKAPHAAFIRFVSKLDADELFDGGAAQVTVLPWSVIGDDVQKILSYRASEEF